VQTSALVVNSLPLSTLGGPECVYSVLLIHAHQYVKEPNEVLQKKAQLKIGNLLSNHANSKELRLLCMWLLRSFNISLHAAVHFQVVMPCSPTIYS